MTYQRIKKDHSVVHNSQVFTHELIVTIKVLEQLLTFLLSIDNDLIEVWSAELLRLNNEVALGFVCEIDVDLVLMHDLLGVCIHLCNVSWLQVIDTADVCRGLVQEVPTDAHLLCLIRLSGDRFLRIRPLLLLHLVNSNLLMTSLLRASIGVAQLVVEILLHHCGVRCLEVARWCRLRLKLEEIRATSLRDLDLIM